MLKVRPKPARLLLVLSADAEPLRIVPMLAQYFGKAAPLESVVHCTSLEAHAAARLYHDSLGVDDNGNSNSNGQKGGLAQEGSNLKYRSQFEAADVIVGLPSRAALATAPGLSKPSVRLILENAADLDALQWDDNVEMIFSDEKRGAGSELIKEGPKGAVGHWLACGPPPILKDAARADFDASEADSKSGSWRYRVVEQPALSTIDCDTATTSNLTTSTVVATWVIPQEQPFDHEAMSGTARAVLLAAASHGLGEEGPESRPLPPPPLQESNSANHMTIQAVRVTCVLRSSRGGFHLMEAQTSTKDIAQLRQENSDQVDGDSRVKATPHRAYEHRWPWSRVEVEVDYEASGGGTLSSSEWCKAATAAVEVALSSALHSNSPALE
jgi:hypothetical protein